MLSLTAPLIIANANLFPNRIARAAQTPADIAANQPGALLRVDTTSINFGKLETSGVDLDLSTSFATSIGKFSPSLLATWVEKYETADVPGAPVFDRVGIANSAGTIPEYRASANLEWSFHGLRLATTVRYTDGYDDATFLNVINNKKVDSQTYVDLSGLVQLDEVFNSASYWAKGFSVRFGVVNLTDEEPAFSEVGPTLGYDPSLADVRQRFAYLSLTKQF